MNAMLGPVRLVDHLSENGYQPRSNAHSNTLCLGILEDLLHHCPRIARDAASGDLVAALNHTVIVNYQRWNIDLALGPPPGTPTPPDVGLPIKMTVPTEIRVAIEVKGVMTEHGKARNNRLRDLQAFHGHAHLYNQKVIAAGLVVVNVSETFWSPLRDEMDVTIHRSIESLGPETIALFRNLPLRNTSSDLPGLEAIAVLVVHHDNLRTNPSVELLSYTPGASHLIAGPPAPPVGDPLSYGTMIHRICAAYRDRWV